MRLSYASSERIRYKSNEVYYESDVVFSKQLSVQEGGGGREVEGRGHYAEHFPKCTSVKIDDFNKNGSAGPHGDYLSLKKKNPSKLKDHHMSHGTPWTLGELH